jgi:hypothetical protein
MNEQLNGRLEDWIFDGFLIWGNLYRDPARRWAEGTRVHTSTVKSKEPFKEGDTIETLNSKYLLGAPESG